MSWLVHSSVLFLVFVSASSTIGEHSLPSHYDGPKRTHIFNIRSFGAIDGQTLNTAAFEVRLEIRPYEQ